MKTAVKTDMQKKKPQTKQTNQKKNLTNDLLQGSVCMSKRQSSLMYVKTYKHNTHKKTKLPFTVYRLWFPCAHMPLLNWVWNALTSLPNAQRDTSDTQSIATLMQLQTNADKYISKKKKTKQIN